MKNNTVTDLQGSALRLYREGKDESTFGPFLEVYHNVFDNVGYGKKNKYKVEMSLYGVQETDIKNNIFKDCKGLNMHLVVGEPLVSVVNNNFYKSDKITVTGDQKYSITNNWKLDPGFIGEEDYSLKSNSSLINKSTDGYNLGVLLKEMK